MDMFYYFENNLYWDFKSISDRIPIPNSTLYRLVKRKCQGKKFRNKLLYKYKDLLGVPEIYKEIKQDEINKKTNFEI